jgi:putative heme-binding domain-containing protein
MLFSQPHFMNPRILSLFCLLSMGIASAQVADQATSASSVKVKQGFKVELLYSVPKDDQGSWVAMTQDDKGRLIVSDQYGSLYRITTGATAADTKVERVPAEFGHCQGLLYTNGVLYGVVNDEAYQGRGLYRVTDSNNDDQLDKVELLKAFPNKGGEHGPHGIVLGPDGKSLYIVSGNQTPLPDMNHSRVPNNWAEDQLSAMLLGRGFMRDVLAPGGWVAKTDLDGKSWELINIGNRNTYDIAFNEHGDLFGYDADMEWDVGTPWYRPTRVAMIVSGGDQGWRTCSKKWPVRWEDSQPAVVDIGPGSPTGVAFGYGAKFPAKYQQALYVCDWSFGKVYAVHMTPDGAHYKGSFEEFMSAAPLPVTDLVVGRHDGALYITIGGRKVQSGLYRVTYAGAEATAATSSAPLNDLHALRAKLESYHGSADGAALEIIWPALGSADRLVRHAARIALEHQPLKTWQGKALGETEPRAALTALMALIRCAPNGNLQQDIVAALNRIDLKSLKGQDRQTLVRNYWLTVSRHGEPAADVAKSITERLLPHFPTRNTGLDRDICELLVMIGDTEIVAKAVPLVNSAPTQEEQIDYARILRNATDGWTPELRADYFKWFPRAANYKGGASFGLFVKEIKDNAMATLSIREKAALRDILEAKPESSAPAFSLKPMQFQKAWMLADLEDSLESGLKAGRDFTNGRNMFGAATCFACHRFNQEGGAVGPDLTSVAGKFSPRDLLDHTLNPNKEISDQYGSTVFTLKDGSVVIGRIANMKEATMMVSTNMMDPNNFTNVDSRQVVKTEESKVSMMPPGLLNMLTKEDVLDLLAYLLNQGDPEAAAFQK